MKYPFSIKNLVYDFIRLPYVKRDKIIQELSLVNEENRNIKHVEILDEIIESTKKLECVEKLWNRIQEEKS